MAANQSTAGTDDLGTTATVLRAAGRAGVAACLWSDPGVGKSSLAAALADADQVPYEVVLGSLREPSDFGGLPVVTGDGVALHAPAWARRLIEAECGYLLLDELSTATPAVQAAMLGVVLDRTVGDVRLPAGVNVLTAANPPERAADGYDLAPPLANRLLHIDFAPPTQDWLDGMTAGFRAPTPRRVHEPSPTRRAVSRALIAAFLRRNPNLLHDYPTDPATTGRAWPSRRTWTMTADVLALLPETDTSARMLAATGLVGPGAATEFLLWCQHADLPDPADVLADPATVTWADLDPSRAWVVLTGTVALATAPATTTAWRSGWAVLAAAADAGLADVSAACARMLLTARPANARPPREARAFTTLLTDAGLIPATTKATA